MPRRWPCRGVPLKGGLLQSLYRIDSKLRIFVTDRLGIGVGLGAEHGLRFRQALELHDGQCFGWLAIEGHALAVAHDVLAATVHDRLGGDRNVLLEVGWRVLDIDLPHDKGGRWDLGLESLTSHRAQRGADENSYNGDVGSFHLVAPACGDPGIQRNGRFRAGMLRPPNSMSALGHLEAND